MAKRAYYHLVCILLTAFLLSNCATQRHTASSGDVVQTGVASWYGPGFHGKQTANGEQYDQDALTAAHRTLPFGTVVRVTNLANGRSIDVRINDRGPYVGNRVIDLSREAARRIDMEHSGLAEVKLELLSAPRNIDRSRINDETFTVQVASFDRKRDAASHARRFRHGWVQDAVVRNRPVYRVYVGNYRNRNDAERLLSSLRNNGINGFVKQVQN